MPERGGQRSGRDADERVHHPSRGRRSWTGARRIEAAVIGPTHRAHSPSAHHVVRRSRRRACKRGAPPLPGSALFVRSGDGWLIGIRGTAVLRLGYKASAEQFGPTELLGFAVLAEQRGFDSV